ncbi:phage baseplate assembly protein V [Natronorarus salvus]|uniref:phage baseplate assembly protein V n=1 Tax=Natronorarus salvus TaxID=3117733 RepID=UPI002F26173F
MSAPGTPTRDDHARSFDGVYVAIVRDNADPQGLGRVRLEYPWRESAAESTWARIAVPMAGHERGTYFLPETGDEVLVAFERGDVDYPYVIGALWNGQDTPPAANRDGNNDIRRITSRNGHQLTFDDADDGGKIVVETAAGHRVVLDDQSGGETITIKDTGGSEIEFDGTTGSLSISSGGTITIDASMMELSSAGNLDIDAGGVLTLNGSLIKLN